MGTGYLNTIACLLILFISLANVKSTNIISAHKTTKPFLEMTTELASLTFNSPAAHFTLTTARVHFYDI